MKDMCNKCEWHVQPFISFERIVLSLSCRMQNHGDMFSICFLSTPWLIISECMWRSIFIFLNFTIRRLIIWIVSSFHRSESGNVFQAILFAFQVFVWEVRNCMRSWREQSMCGKVRVQLGFSLLALCVAHYFFTVSFFLVLVQFFVWWQTTTGKNTTNRDVL